MTRGDTGSQGENTGVDKEWQGEEEVVELPVQNTTMDIETKYMLYQCMITMIQMWYIFILPFFLFSFVHIRQEQSVFLNNKDRYVSNIWQIIERKKNPLFLQWYVAGHFLEKVNFVNVIT